MKRLRIFLLPLAVVAELILLVGAGLLAWFDTKRSARITGWALAELPDMKWYFGHDT